ncbi:hypothetical protein [Lacinutrix sp. MEBiC02404]
MKNLKNLGKALSKAEQQFITGGKGDWAVRCASGALIENAPDGSAETAAWACHNQGGATASICAGSNC